MNYKYHLNNAKFKGVFPFYISDINDKFFVSLNNHPNKHFVQKILPLIYSKLDHQSSLEFQALENLTKEERIRLMLNLALKKIISKTGSKTIPLFQNLNPNQPSNPIYIQQLWESDRYYQDEEAQIERRYNFVININQKSYLTNYLNQIQLSFYLDEENKILSGGFSLNFENNNPNITFHETVRKIYLRSLIHNFIIKQLYPLSLNNILELVPDYPNNSQLGKQRHQKKPYLKFVSNDLDRIKANWNNLIEKKYLRYVSLTEAGKQYYYDDLFFSIMISVMVILLLYQELKIYFTSKTPELILGLLTKNLDPVQEGPSSAKRDFYQLSKYLQTQYFAQKPRINVKKIRDPEELIDAIAKARADYGFESFGYPVPIYEIVIDFQGVIISADSIFHANDHLKSIYLMIILPELFGLDEDTTYFVDYGQLLQIIAADSFTAK